MEDLQVGDVVRLNEIRPHWTSEEQNDTWIITDIEGTDCARLKSASRGTVCLTPNNSRPGRQGWVSTDRLTRDGFLTAVRAAALSKTQPT